MPVYSEGHRLLSEIPGSLSELSKRLGVSKAVVGFWRNGKVPNDRMKARLHDVYGILPAAWSKVPEGKARVAIVAPDAPASQQPASNEDSIALLMRLARVGMQDAQLTSSERAKWAATFGTALRQKIQLERDAALLEDRLVTEHPKWKRLRAAILAALRDHPAALRAVIEALESQLAVDE